MLKADEGGIIIIPTPIGNLGDITLRAIEYLKTLDLLLCEDTRVTRKLLSHLQISIPLKSYHAHNEHYKTTEIIGLLKEGKRIGLVSDAGMPGISDPAYLLIREALLHDIQIEVLPGASSFLPALVGSGLPCDKFYFEGFLPHKKGRKTRLDFLAQLPVTFILFESPHRIDRSLKQLIEHCGKDRPACLTREISKIHEEYIRGSLDDIAQKISTRPGKLKGEIVLIIGAPNSTN
jgi:16S rRNA (cytidine1402-2'-O)-methyltransferase